MIEPDINERMARFAPSQNVGNEPDPIALEVLAETEADAPPPMAPGFDPIAVQIARESQDEMMATLRGASAVNPDQAARAQRIGQQVGIGQDVVLRNMAEMEREVVARQAIDRDLMRTAPNLARFLGQREFATIAHDDIDNLTKTERVFKWFAGIPKDVEEGLSRAVATAELGKMYEAQMRGVEPTWLDRVVIQGYNDELRRLSKESGFIESAANLVGIRVEMAAQVPEQVLMGTVMGGAAGLVGGPFAPATVPAGMAIGATAGLTVGMGRAGYILEAGNAYGSMVEEADTVLRQRRDAGEIDAATYESEMREVRDRARTIATGVGVVNAGLELVGLKMIAAPFREAFKGAVRRATAQAVTQQTTRAALGRAGMQYGLAIAGETGTEVMQEIVTVAGEELNSYGADLPLKMSTEEGRTEVAQRLVDTAVETAKGMALVGLPGPVVNYYVNTRKVAEARKAERFFTDLADVSKQDKVAERSPAAYERFLAAQAEGTQAETIYVDARTMQSVLQQAQRADPALTDEVIDEAMPGIREQIAQQLETGGDVTIPTATFGARLARTDLGRSLIPHMRLNPDALSVDEAVRYRGQMEERRQEAMRLMQEQDAAGTSFSQEAETVRDDVRARLEAAGRSREEADIGSLLYRDFVVTNAARMGMTPAQFQAERGLREIVGAEVGVAPLEQAATMNADYLAAVERGDMEAAQRMVDEAAKARGMMFRGHKRNRPQGVTETFVSESREQAQQFANQHSDGVVSLVRFTKPLRVYEQLIPWQEYQDSWRNSVLLKGYDAVRVIEPNGQDTSLAIRNQESIGFESADPVTYDEAGNVIPLSRRFDITSPRIFEQAAMSTRVPSAKGMEMAALDGMLLADWDAMKDNEKLIAGNLAKIKELGFPVKLDETKTPREQLEQFMEAVADNLDYLYEQMDPTQRERAKMWYVGGRRIVEWLAARYGITDMQAAAMLAVLSPQKNWFENVSMADRIGDILTSARNERWSPEMEKNFRRMVEDVRARVTITERQIADNEKPEKPTKPRTEESLEDFKARKKSFDARRPRLKAKYERDLAQWEQELEEYEVELAELQESGESTTMIRADMAAHRRERPKSPRMPGRVLAESAVEFAARNEQYEKDLAEWEKRGTRLAKILKSKQDRIKYLDDLSASPRMQAMREGTLQTVLASKDLELAGMFVRMFDEEHNDRTFAIITPEGGMAGPSMGASGPMSMRWGSYSTIQKAISVYEDGRAENVHHQIGKAHKVRNFYNNLFDPTNVNAATIDTHAIAAGALMPLSASDDIVGWGLGAGVSDAKLGLHGGYPILFEAYRRAAARRGIIAREEQSITWEAIRGLFVAAEKKTLKPIIAEVWGRYMKGDISLEDARAQVFKLAGGIKTPEWVAQPANLPVGSTYSGRSRSLMDAMTPAIQQQMQQMTRLMFEIAPDLRDEKLSAAWKALPMEIRHAISRSVMAKIVPKILKEYGVTAAIEEQIGGWEGGTELSFAMSLPSTTLVRQISQALREVLSQKAIFSISEQKFEGASRAGLVVIDLQPGTTPEQITELYEKRLYQVTKLGHSTVGSSMVIGLNEGVDSGELARRIDAELGNDPLIVRIKHGEAWSLYDESPEQTVEGAAVDERGLARVDERRRLDALREQATELIVKELRAAGLYEQAAAGPARGGFDFGRLKILLGERADATTFLHELVHFYMHTYTTAAAEGRADAQMLADLDILFRWLNVEGDTPEARLKTYLARTFEQRRPDEEAIAYNSEIYMWEGKAPSAELRGVFERMRTFFNRVYKSIRDELNAIYRREFGKDLPILTGEVRQVFDRMLAAPEAIRRQQAIDGIKPAFLTREQAGVDEAQWAEHQAALADAEAIAINDMTKASLRTVQWLSNARSRIVKEMQSKHDAKRKEVRDEVAAQVRMEPAYRAQAYLRYGKFIDADGQEVEVDGPHKLDLDTVKQMYELEPEALRPDVTAMARGKYGFVGKDGLNPDMIAETFGYSSGDQMIRAVMGLKPIKEAIDERTDAVMVERFSDLNSKAAVDAEVQKSLHNEARARFVAIELKFAAKATEPTRVIVEAARQAARDIIAAKKVRDVRPSEHVAAEARASKDAVMLAGKTEIPDSLKVRYPTGTVNEALIRAKRQEMYQNQLAEEALRVKDEVDKDVKYLRRILRDENVKRMGADAADQVAELLSRFDVAAVPLKILDRRKQTLSAWMEAKADGGIVPDIAPELLEAGRRVNYREMTVAEFRDLVSAVKQIEYVGKNERKLQLAEERAEFEEKRDDIVTRIRATGRLRGLDIDPRSPLTNIGRTVSKLQAFAAAHLKAASIARVMDGGKDDGPLWNTVIRTANAAADMETRMRSEATAKLAEILKPVFALGNMGGKGMFFRSINRSLNREARIAIALNMGNAGNMQRLLDGEGWNMAQVQPILESLTAAEWNAVQQVWDFLETYRPLVAAKERRLYGKEPNWVEPQPLTVRTSDGQTLTMRGGYYPVKYDPVASDRVATFDEVQEAKDALRGTYTAATTRRSFTKARAEKVVGRPILYTLDAAFSGVNDVIHDLAWHEWLISTNRLLRDEKFANAVRETRGPEFLRQLREWAKANAAGDRPANVEGALSWLRQGISASGLGFNVMSAALQITGFNQSVVRVGAKWVGLGIAEFTASPLVTSQFVREKSSFMAERQRTQFRELNELRNTVRGKGAGVRKVLAQAYVAMMTMQRAVDTPTWVGAYRKALTGGKDDATAVALADQAVKDSQGSGLTADLAAIERGGPGLKLFTVFYSYMNTVYNMAAVQTYTARGRGKLAADYVMLLVVPVVLGHAIKALLTPDAGDDDFDPEALARKLAAEELSFLMGTMVVAREFGGAAQLLTGAEGARMGYGGPAGVRAIGEAYNLATQTGQMEFDRAFVRSAINTLGAFTGLPSAQINRTIDGVEAILEGEVEGVGAVIAPLTGVKK